MHSTPIIHPSSSSFLLVTYLPLPLHLPSLSCLLSRFLLPHRLPLPRARQPIHLPHHINQPHSPRNLLHPGHPLQILRPRPRMHCPILANPPLPVPRPLRLHIARQAPMLQVSFYIWTVSEGWGGVEELRVAYGYLDGRRYFACWCGGAQKFGVGSLSYIEAVGDCGTDIDTAGESAAECACTGDTGLGTGPAYAC